MIALTDSQLMDWLAAFLLPTFRILGLFTTAPVLSQRVIPRRVRVGVAVLLAITIAPNVPLPPGSLVSSAALLPVVAQEALIGLTLGFTARVVFSAFELAGEMIGLQMGLSFAGFFDPQSGAANPASRFLNLSALTCFVVMGGPELLVTAVGETFRTIPVDGGFAWLATRSPLALGAEVFAMAFSLALPFMAMLLFVNLALGIMSRIAPQFSVFAVGFPLTIGIGLVLLALVFPLLTTLVERAFGTLVSVLG